MFRVHETAETWSFLDYYNKVLCIGGLSYCHAITISEEVTLIYIIKISTRDKIIEICDLHF
jgi:hypothetical protein